MVRQHMHHELNLKKMGKDSGATGPKNEAWQVKLSDPAQVVMTDFRDRTFFKVDAEERIEDALQKMKHAGLRAAFVLDTRNDKLLGLVTSYDIMGEKPLRFMQSAGFTEHKDIVVADIMEEVGQMVSLDVREVEKATVQAVLNVLQKSGRTHVPVVEVKEGEPPHLRGLFSASRVLRLTEDSRRAAA